MLGLEQGELQGGQVDVSERDAVAHAPVSKGRFSLRRSSCSSHTCAFELRTLELAVRDFALGGFEFSNIHARLAAPARGDLKDTTVRMPGSALRFLVSFDLALTGESMFEGGSYTVEMSADGEATATMTPDSRFSIDHLVLTNWPVEMKLTTVPAPIHATVGE